MTLRKQIFALALLVALLVPVADAAADRCGRPGLAPIQATDHQLRTSTLCLINRMREQRDIPPLAYNSALRRSATAHSVSMVSSGSLSHYGPAGSTLISRIARSGYLSRVSRYRLAENIGAGTGRRFGSPFAIVSEWMHSPGHRANILDPALHDFGVGISRGSPFGGGYRKSATYTLDLGMRLR